MASTQGTPLEYRVSLLDLSTFKTLLDGPVILSGPHLSMAQGRCCLIGSARPGSKRGVDLTRVRTELRLTQRAPTQKPEKSWARP